MYVMRAHVQLLVTVQTSRYRRKSRARHSPAGTIELPRRKSLLLCSTIYQRIDILGAKMLTKQLDYLVRVCYLARSLVLMSLYLMVLFVRVIEFFLVWLVSSRSLWQSIVELNVTLTLPKVPVFTQYFSVKSSSCVKVTPEVVLRDVPSIFRVPLSDSATGASSPNLMRWGRDSNPYKFAFCWEKQSATAGERMAALPPHHSMCCCSSFFQVLI